MRLSQVIENAAKARDLHLQAKFDGAWRRTLEGRQYEDICVSVTEFLDPLNTPNKTLAGVHAFVNGITEYRGDVPGQDHWQSAQETLDLGTGDCEDYALLYAALGLRCGLMGRWTIDVVRDVDTGEPHAVLTVDDEWVLDNVCPHPVTLDAHRSVWKEVVRLLSVDDSYGFPRRNRLDRMTPAELAITDAMAAVEEAGADVRLTDAVVLLGRARDRVADFVDDVEV